MYYCALVSNLFLSIVHNTVCYCINGIFTDLWAREPWYQLSFHVAHVMHVLFVLYCARCIYHLCT